jgi:hypothetical protein
MMRKLGLAAIVTVGMAVVASSQTVTETRTRVETPIMISGEIVRFEPGKMIVIRSGGKEVSYVLTPEVVVPADITTGKTVNMQIENGPDGSQLVRSVTTTSVGPGGQVTETTETTTTPLTATVEAYMPGKSITIIDSKGAKATYFLAPDAQLPQEMIMGKRVTILTPKGKPKGTVYVLERDGDEIKLKAKKLD